MAESVLARARSERTILQEFRPLAESLEWQIGQRYWQERGSQAFLSDAVPYVINNDGLLSRNAAEVLFASLQSTERAGTLPEEVVVLELGIGVGLFARLFLDAFRALCEQHEKDYYDRLCYIAADRSVRMLNDVCRHGLLANHPGRYRLRVVDALQPEHGLMEDVAMARQGPRPLYAVFLNYILDCLPAAVLEFTGQEVRQLCVQTCLARGSDLREFTDLSPGQIVRLSASEDPEDQRELLELSGFFSAEYAYLPVDIGQIPYGDFALRVARPLARRTLHSYGAIRCLERLLELVQEQGFILVNDYGWTELDLGNWFEHQHFSRSTALGLNFALLKRYCAEGQTCRWVEPLPDRDGIYSRLLALRPAHETVVCFYECFSKAAAERVREPVDRARELVKAGRFDAAVTRYLQALERQPNNWVLMNEIGVFLTQSLRNPKAAIDMARVGLGLNPTSADLWSTLGDALFEAGRTPESRQAYLRALQLNPRDLRARFNLAWVCTREKSYEAALHEIAECLALDSTGAQRDRLLKKQEEVLALLTQRQMQEQFRLANRISTPRSDTPPVGAETDRLGSAALPHKVIHPIACNGQATLRESERSSP